MSCNEQDCPVKAHDTRRIFLRLRRLVEEANAGILSRCDLVARKPRTPQGMREEPSVVRPLRAELRGSEHPRSQDGARRQAIHPRHRDGTPLPSFDADLPLRRDDGPARGAEVRCRTPLVTAGVEMDVLGIAYDQFADEPREAVMAYPLGGDFDRRSSSPRGRHTSGEFRIRICRGYNQAARIRTARDWMISPESRSGDHGDRLDWRGNPGAAADSRIWLISSAETSS
jgi:hypothetical protein